MRGAQPKDNARTRHPRAHDWIDVPAVPFGGPPLREVIPGVRWKKLTLAWWETVRTLPHARSWEPADWMFAARTAMLVNDPNAMAPTMVAQITRREATIGMTDAQRRQNRIRYVDGAGEAVAPQDADVRRLRAVE